MKSEKKEPAKKELPAAKKAAAMTSDPEITEVRGKSRYCVASTDDRCWQVTEEEAKKIEQESKKEQPSPSAAKVVNTSAPTTTSSDAEKKEVPPAAASETKKVRVQVGIMT